MANRKGAPRKSHANNKKSPTRKPKEEKVEENNTQEDTAKVEATESRTLSEDEVKSISQEYEPETKEPPEKVDTFEFKDRFYYLKGDKKPVIHILRSKRLMYFDEEMGQEREMMFTENQKTPFVDEFKGEPRATHILFKEGVLHVPKEKKVWQLILSKYHPDLGRIYEEQDEEKDAIDELSQWEIKIDALNLAKNMDITKAESIVRTKVGSIASKMSSKEIMRDLILLAEENPQLVIDLANDENIEARNLGIKAVEQGIIKLSKDHRVFTLASNGRKLLEVKYEEHPYTALVSWFKTDEGLELYSLLEKKVV